MCTQTRTGGAGTTGWEPHLAVLAADIHVAARAFPRQGWDTKPSKARATERGGVVWGQCHEFCDRERPRRARARCGDCSAGRRAHGRCARRRASPRTLGRRPDLLARSSARDQGLQPGLQGKGAKDDGRALCNLRGAGMPLLLLWHGQGEEKGKGKGKGKSEECACPEA